MQTQWLNIAGLLLTVIACAVLYLGLPNQQWFSKRVIRFQPALLVFLILSAGSGYLFSHNLSALSATFAVLSSQMLMLGLLPLYTHLPKACTNTLKAKTWLKRFADSGDHKPRWLLKISGSVLLGFPLAVLAACLLGVIAFADTPLDVRSQLIMWFITPFWLLPVSLIFFSRRPLIVLAVLTVAALSIYAVLPLALTSGV